MIRVLLLILLLNPLLFSAARAFPVPGKGVEVKLVIPGKTEQMESTPCVSLKVLIINHTDTAVSFFDDSNLWGYYNLHLEIRTKDSVYFLTKPERDWTKNYPSFKTLFPGDSLELSFSKNVMGCSFFQFEGPCNAVLSPGNSIKAVYRLNSGVLEEARSIRFADSTEMVKYKYRYTGKESGRRTSSSGKAGDWVVVDSLKVPVPLIRTFTVDRLESDEYKLY